jgi:conjugal transfer ATP-binding protein TraC
MDAQVLSLHKAPKRTYPGILSAPRAPEKGTPLALWDTCTTPLSVVVNLTVIDQAREQARLRTKRNFAFLQRFNVFGDETPENVALKKELDALITDFFINGGQMLWGRVHVVVWGTPQEVPLHAEKIRQHGKALDLDWAKETTLGSTLFLQTLPLGFDPDFPAEKWVRRAFHLPAAHFARILPLYGGFRGTGTASIMYLNQRGELVAFDPFDNRTNPHMVVTGMSGGGKSFTMVDLTQQMLTVGASMVILDRLASYKEVCAAWRGTYIEMDFNTPVCFNPFYGPLDNEHVAFLTACLAEMASGGMEQLGREALNVLADAIACFAQDWEPSSGEPTLGRFVETVLKTGTFTVDEESRSLGRELARKLSMFYGRGPYAGFFDGPNQLALHPTLTVIELSKLGKAYDLQGSALFALMHLLTQFFTAQERRHRKKFFLCDETIFLLKHPVTAAPLEEIERTFRKLRTCAIFLAQYGTDFNSPAGEVIRKGSPTLLFLQQEKEESDAIANILGLTDAERAMLPRCKRHEGWSSGFLRLGASEGGMVRLVPDELTVALAGQGEAERSMRERYIEEAHGDLQQAMAALVADHRRAYA